VFKFPGIIVAKSTFFAGTTGIHVVSGALKLIGHTTTSGELLEEYPAGSTAKAGGFFADAVT